MKVLITGADSPLGIEVCKSAKSQGLTVWGSTRNKPLIPNLKNCLDRHIVLELSEAKTFLNITEDIDSIIHIAAASEGGACDLFDINGMGTQRLILRAAELGIGRIIHVSSMSVYGEVASPLVSHRTPVNHQSYYGLSKWAAECYLRSVFNNIRTCSIRCPAIVGRISHRHFLAVLCDKMRAGAREVHVSNPTFYFNNVVHTDELVAFLLGMLSQKLTEYEVFPVCSSGGMTLQDIVDKIKHKLKYEGNIIWSRANSPPFRIDCGNAESFGFQPASVERTLDRWLRDF